MKKFTNIFLCIKEESVVISDWFLLTLCKRITRGSIRSALVLFLLQLCVLEVNAQAENYTKSSRGISQTKTIECADMKAGQIYSKIVEYLDHAYVESNAVTKNADNVNNQVIASGYYAPGLKTTKVTDWGIPNTFPTGSLPIDIHHHLKVKCEDGKANVKISIDYYTLCRAAMYSQSGCYCMNIDVLKVKPFGQYAAEDHPKAKLINKAMGNDNIFEVLDEQVNKQFKEIEEFILDDF